MKRRRRLSQYGDENRVQVDRSIELQLPGRIAVVSDSHSLMHPNTLAFLRERKPSYILHAGDIGRLEVLELLETICPVIAVRGNIDQLTSAIPDDVLISVTVDGVQVSKWLLTHIAVRGPRLLKSVRERSRKLGVSLVVCGHSHVPLLACQDGITVFNPGSVGPRRFNLPIVFGEIALTPTSITCAHYSCETGTRWLPAR